MPALGESADFCGRPPKRGDGSASYCYYAAWLCFFNTDGKRTCNPHHTRLSFNFCRKQIGSLRRKPAETGGATSAARRQRQLDRRWRPSSIGSFPVPTEQVVTRGPSVIMSMLYEAESATAASDRTPPPRWVSHLGVPAHAHANALVAVLNRKKMTRDTRDTPRHPAINRNKCDSISKRLLCDDVPPRHAPRHDYRRY
jgi:hypothetical protein